MDKRSLFLFIACTSLSLCSSLFPVPDGDSHDDPPELQHRLTAIPGTHHDGTHAHGPVRHKDGRIGAYFCVRCSKPMKLPAASCGVSCYYTIIPSLQWEGAKGRVEAVVSLHVTPTCPPVKREASKR
jgi:hypothetical protein